MLSIIVAMANDNVIGKENKLIWHLPEDLKRFKKITTGKTIIMGRKTFESLGRVLPNRKHIVLSKSNFNIENENVEILKDIKELDKYINSKEEFFVIGGATIYKLLLPYTNKIYLTQIYENFVGDTFFPKIEEKDWQIENREKGIKDEQNNLNYEYITFIRREFI